MMSTCVRGTGHKQVTARNQGGTGRLPQWPCVLNRKETIKGTAGVPQEVGRSAYSARPSLGERGRVLSLPFPGNRGHTWVLPPTWCTQASDGSAEIDSPSEVGPPRRSWVCVSDPRSVNQRALGVEGL
ncbi:hypothetical protein NDU88_003492 [Pleurodeles waltl]|uniref:Uncharacterized protein n=1 Tax=Pleurodeles waltl TaxID=8319 RepID=A0AAV7W663_PLEWA|nr:hypothetical protein NDU88_003492 [Pleurodeles waltl]